MVCLVHRDLMIDGPSWIYSIIEMQLSACTEDAELGRRRSFQALSSLRNAAQCTCHATIRSQRLLRLDQRLQVAGALGGGSACRDATGGCLLA